MTEGGHLNRSDGVVIFSSSFVRQREGLIPIQWQTLHITVFVLHVLGQEAVSCRAFNTHTNTLQAQTTSLLPAYVLGEQAQLLDHRAGG